MKRSLILGRFLPTSQALRRPSFSGRPVAKNTKHLRQHGCVTCHFWSPSIFHIQTSYWWVYIYISLVGGLEHGFFSHHIGNGIIIPSDFHSIIFQRGRAQPPTRSPWYHIKSHWSIMSLGEIPSNHNLHAAEFPWVPLCLPLQTPCVVLHKFTYLYAWLVLLAKKTDRNLKGFWDLDEFSQVFGSICPDFSVDSPRFIGQDPRHQDRYGRTERSSVGGAELVVFMAADWCQRAISMGITLW